MTIETIMLLASLALLFVLTGIQALISIKNFGVAKVAGPRDAVPFPQPGLGGRIYRAIENLKENLFYFIPLILLATILGISNEQTVLGSQIFFVARLFHAPLYLLGIPFIRAVAFACGVIGCLMVACGLFI